MIHAIVYSNLPPAEKTFDRVLEEVMTVAGNHRQCPETNPVPRLYQQPNPQAASGRACLGLYGACPTNRSKRN